MGELVFQDLKGVINSLYPESEKHDFLEQTRFEHEVFAESRFNVYIERKEYFDKLDAHVKDNGLPLVVMGESGSGKSALFANWANKYKENEVDKLFLLAHYVGATPDSVDWASMLRRIMGELKLHFDIQKDIPDKPDELKAAFANWLHMAAAKGKMVLIIDALNQLEDRDGALELYWLPEMIPPNIRLVVSSLPSRSLDELKKRGWPTMEVKPLDVQERQKLIVDYLGQSRKALPMQMVEYIASYNQSSNPLYLITLLEEIRLYGDHFTLPQRIDHYLAAPTADGLYDKILERYEQDYDRDRRNLVRDIFSYLWASRNGLSQIELLEILGSDGDQLSGALLSPLYLSAEKSLVNRSGLLSFSHYYFKTAVKKRYLEAKGEEQRYHLLLASYFEKRELGKRKVEELPWQLSRAESWNRLVDLLTDSSFFNAIWDSNEFDVKEYWVLIEDKSELRMVQAYEPIIDSPLEHDYKFTFRVSNLLHSSGHPSKSFSLLNSLTEYYRKKGMNDRLQASLGHQALILYFRGNYDEAMKLFKEEERMCRELRNKECLGNSLGNQALILFRRSDLKGAMKLRKEEERIFTELGNRDRLAISLSNQALILSERNDLKGAMKLHKEEERICRELGNIEGLAISLGNQALILRKNDPKGAMELHKEQERICRKLGNKEGLQASLGGQANILFKDDLDGAMKLYKEQERICREQENKEGLQRSLGNQAGILSEKGKMKEAIKLLKEQEIICREMGNKDSLQISLGNQANILKRKGAIDEAFKLYKEKEEICRELGNK